VGGADLRASSRVGRREGWMKIILDPESVN